MISRIKGTQDFLDTTLFNFFIEAVKKHLAVYHFSEIATPIIEPVDLFIRTLGRETDIVSKEMFLLQSKTDTVSKQICLRPEGTAPIMRAFLESSVQNVPWKVFSHGPMFRYERPQKGRSRQFHQITLEIIGAESFYEDVQLLTMLDRLFQEVLKLDNFALLINYLGTVQDRESFKKMIYQFLNQHEAILCEHCKIRKEINILRIFDCKNVTCKELYKNAPRIYDYFSKESQKEWQEIQEQLQLLSVPYSVDPLLVRGLDYYDKVVFEFVSENLGAQNAFCAGGRYNRLAQEIGSKKDYPSIGAAIGIERILLLLELYKDTLPLPPLKPLHIIIPVEDAQIPLALLIADELHAATITTEILFDGSLKHKMRSAHRMGARYVIFIGPEELAQHQVNIKDMITGSEEKMAQSILVEFLKK